MTTIELKNSVRFVVDQGGRPMAAQVDIRTWEALMNMWEELEDTAIARRALAELNAAGGRPEGAGWLRWEEIESEWDDDALGGTGGAV